MNLQYTSMPDNNIKCHVFHGGPQTIQGDMTSFLEGKKHLKINSMVQSQSVTNAGASKPEILVTITLLYTEAETEREHILGFTDKR